MPIVSRKGAATSQGFGQFGSTGGTGRLLYIWGTNQYGEALTGISENINSPVVASAYSDYSVINRGYACSAFVKPNGTLWVVGYNGYGLAGNSSVSPTIIYSPVQVGSATNWATAACGLYNWIAIKTDGTMWACGYNQYATLGLGDLVYRSSPVQIGSASNWSKISMAYYDAFAIRTDGTLWGWGYNYYGQVGNNTADLGVGNYIRSPVQVGAATDWSEIRAQQYTTLGLRGTSLYAWGWNQNGQVGDNTGASRSSPVQIAGTWSKIGSSDYNSYGIKSDGTLWVWGWNYYGELGNPTLTTGPIGPNVSSPTQVGVDSNWANIENAYYGAFASKTNGSVWRWGYGGSGAIGDLGFESRSSPTQIGIYTSPILIPGSSYENYVVKQSVGSPYAWGTNGYGQVFLKSAITTSPVLSTAVKKAYSTALIGSGVFAGKTKDGKYYLAAPYNLYGQQGNLTRTSVYSPVLLSGTWNDISVNQYNFAGIKSDGTLWACGFNSQGQVGDLSVVSRSSPVQIGSDTNWSKVVCNSPYYTLALKTNGTLWAWGYNQTYGLLGLNDTDNRSSPIQVGPETTWSDISQGQYYASYAFRGTTLYAWGYNQYGQLGINNTITTSSPVGVGTYSKAYPGLNFVLLLRSNGTLWSCGRNTNGSLGQNNTTDYSSPVQIGAATDWAKAQVWRYAWNAIKTNGTLWGCGYGAEGQIGDGTTVDKSSPVQIGSDTNWTDFINVGGAGFTAGAFK